MNVHLWGDWGRILRPTMAWAKRLVPLLPRKWVTSQRLVPLLPLLLLPTVVVAEPIVPQYPPVAEVKAGFLRLLDRPKVPLDVRITQTNSSTVQGVELLEQRLSLASEAPTGDGQERVPLLLLRPRAEPGKLPVVVVLHGTGGSKEGQRPLLQRLAVRGYLAVSLDGRYHGERLGPGYTTAIIQAWRSQPPQKPRYPFFLDTCWDVWRTLDYLQTRPDVDGERIGMIGFSKGGIETWLAAAVDERVRVAIPTIAVQSFRWSLDHDQWQGRAKTIQAAHEAAAKDLGEPKVNANVCRHLWNKVIPGLLDPYDAPSMLRLFAGRPLMIVNGEKDPNCPLPGAEIAFAAARQAFAQAKATDKLKIVVAPGVAHQVTAEHLNEAIEWFDRWLKPSAPKPAAPNP